ncbi:MAG: ligand-binding sensor domain-containing protein [Mucilaginibacter sp.]
MLLNTTVCLSQKYAFSHYDIEDGLIQSQVNDLCLDNEHRLWMATYGGASRFDGKEFLSYSRQNGMPGNFVNSVFVDKNDVVWFGTQNGLVKLQNRKLTKLSLPAGLTDNRARNMVQDTYGTIWTIINNKLFKIKGNTVQQQWVQDTLKENLTTLATDGSGKLLASVYKKGLYRFDNGKWTSVTSYPAVDKKFYVVKILADKTDKQKLYLQTYAGIYTIEDGKLVPYESKPVSSIRSYLMSFTQDADGNFWIGTANGAYYLKNHQLTHFIAKNGLTDNAISDVYNDIDNNLWFASQGNGLYKYEGDHFVTLDKSQGLPDNEVVMAVSQDRNGDIIMGIDGSGLMRYNGKKLSPIVVPDKNPELKLVLSLHKDRKGTLWIGTHGGLWSYNNNDVKEIKGLSGYLINGLTEDNNGTLWGITHGGCFYIENGKAKRLNGLNNFTSSIIGLGKDSVMIGTDDGVVLVVNKHVIKGFDIKPVRTSDVFCMLNYRDMLIIGTDDRGVFTWNKTNGEVKNYSLKDGLNSNAVYSLVADDKGVIWTGTGRGVNRLIFDSRKNKFTVSGNGAKSVILESNQNAALYANNKIWIGTTKGAIIYDPNAQRSHSAPPHVIIQSARLIPQAPSNDWANSIILTNGVKLSHNQNHLAIWFLGVYMKDPDGVSYSYKLKGLDSAYSPLSKNDGVDYPSLPPGKYTFEVKAIAADGTPSDNTASFSFSITPPFYQTLWFRISGIVFFILLGISLQNYRHRTKLKRQRIIEATRREESQKIRQQTAEDFHDELGNKLTRITVLSDILDTKMDQTQIDQKKLLEQIRQNAASLYNGTKDILWALDPRSDNLFEILNHIRDFGNELFLDTPVEFEFNGIDESLNQVKLPMEYSRNIPMIFKELLNNILKHAHANRVVLSLCDIHKDGLHLTLQDNGCGFEQNGTYKGQGINNIIMRTHRIGGDIRIDSEKGKGTLVDLNIKLNRNS